MKTSWFLKFTEICFAVLAITNLMLIVPEVFPEFVSYAIMEYLEWGSLFLPFILGLMLATIWHRAENRDFDSAFRHAWLRTIIRYWLAFSIATYGFAKILKTQFGASYHRMDTPVGLLNRFELTWNYFAHSYVLAVILGVIQIFGSALLLFRRTTLLVACILLPVMTNIVLINWIISELAN